MTAEAKDPFDPAGPCVNNSDVFANAKIVDLSAVDYDCTALSLVVPRAIYVGVAGDIKVDAYLNGTGDGQGVTFKSVPAGTVLKMRVMKIYKTGTTATNLLALW